MKRKHLKDAPEDAHEKDLLEKAFFSRNLEIDPNDLDGTVAQHPQHFHRVCEELAFAASRRDEAKDDLKRTEARLYMQLKDEVDGGEDKKKKKLTETQLKHAVTLHEDMERAQKRLRNRGREADQWEALKDAYHARRYMISDLVALHLGAYFTPSSAGRTREAQERDLQDRRRMMQEKRKQSEE
jgi:hypothetical protein